MALANAMDTFRHWLGDSYDLDAMVAVCALAACEHLTGDTPWLLIVSGSGFTKTETVSALRGAGAHVTSTITSEGALLSATSKREKAKDATGGLLRVVGDSGVLVIKDVTSILSMGRELRSSVLAALREVADGYWERNVGTDGGRTLTWSGRCIVVGAVTTSWDKHHGVVAEMGDRFLLLRMDSDDTDNRSSAGKSSLRQTGAEVSMRDDLGGAVAAVLAAMSTDETKLTDEDEDLLLGLADIVTRCRTAVERDFKGAPEWAHATEAPTRLAKYLWQLVRGSLAIGVTRPEAHALAIRVARDCLPPNRRDVLFYVAEHPYSRTGDVAKGLQLPYATADRTLQELHLLKALQVADDDGQDKRWRYTVKDSLLGEHLRLLASVGKAFPGGIPPEKSVPTPRPQRRESDSEPRVRPATDISGENSAPPSAGISAPLPGLNP